MHLYFRNEDGLPVKLLYVLDNRMLHYLQLSMPTMMVLGLLTRNYAVIMIRENSVCVVGGIGKRIGEISGPMELYKNLKTVIIKNKNKKRERLKRICQLELFDVMT